MDKRAVLIAGPTASGKSALALELAERCRGEIVNADSMQVYTELRILTARPPSADLLRAPHHLYGHVDAARAYSVADWRIEAMRVIDNIWKRGHLPIIVGGTGMYFRVLIEGIAQIPAIPLPIRNAVRAMTTEEIAAALAHEDPHIAARLNANDRQRQARALEVIRASGQSLDGFRQNSPGLEADTSLLRLVLEPPRTTLYAQCDARLERMLESGALEEVARLLSRQLPPDQPVMKALGVQPFAAQLAGDLSPTEALAQARLSTRHYAKRQLTWFRNQCADWRRITPEGIADVADQLLVMRP